MQLPPASSSQLTTHIRELWHAIVTNAVSAGVPAYFPEGAYLQVKAIPNARADFTSRLLAGYAKDIAAAHHLLEPDPSSAQLLGVRVPEAHAHWVSPGACYNRVGYYEVPNARVVYRQAGTIKSFGIASMISWRGVWYVVHLGAVLESGVVDDPATGVGVSAPSSTC
jgi:hypothetical protein